MDMQRAQMLRQCIEDGQRVLQETQRTIVAHPCADENDLASHNENTSANILIMQRFGRQLRQLEHCAAVIESQSHSRCIDCEEEIPLRRLAIQPAAVRCVDCQEEWETKRTAAWLPDEHGLDFYNA